MKPMLPFLFLSFITLVLPASESSNPGYSIFKNENHQHIKSFTTNNDGADLALVGNSEHFEFYTSIADQEGFYLDFVTDLEYRYVMYQSIWERPSSNTIFPEVGKVKVIFTQRSAFPNFDLNATPWDCGTFNFEAGEIYISPLDTEEKIGYYGTLGDLMFNELAQMALSGWLDEDLAHWFSEGFGLYEMGYRPNRQQLLNKLSELGTEEPPISILENIDNLPLTGNKDLMASFFQSKILIHCYFFGFWGDDTYKWWQIIKHYYTKELDRIELIHSTAHFDYFAAEKEMPYLDAMAVNMEEQLALQELRFGQLMRHRVNICIYDNEVGKEINNRTDFQGLACGADKINTSHLEIDHYGLINHEFMHSWVNMMSPLQFASNGIPIPGQFLNEGLAESTDRFMSDEEMPAHRYKIDDLYYHYQRKYNREPTWMEIVDNAEVNKEDGFWVDAYALGEMYWRYMNDKYPDNFWENVKLFLQNGRDWTVFDGKSAEQEGAEFIRFMKELAFVGPPLETTSIPFLEDFRNEFTGWTRMRFGGNDHWQVQNNMGFDDNFCAYAVEPYWLEEKEIDSWLVSPPLDASSFDSLKVQFMYLQTGSGKKPEVYYSNNFSGPTMNTEWISVENLNWNAPEGTWQKMEFKLVDPPEKLFIALRFTSTEGDVFSYVIDNFTVTQTFNEPLAELPFTDNFSNNYENWTTVSVTGDDVWHISNDDGIDFGKCARFYPTSNPRQANNDWLVSPVFNTEGITNLAVTFKYLFTVDGASPEFYYATAFDGNPANSNWVHIDKSFWINNWGWQDARIEIANPGESFVFALRYNVTANDSYYFLMDDLSIDGSTELDAMPLPFTDDFEESIVAEAMFEKWTTENQVGWNYWHIIPGGGNGGQCMRFEICDTDQNDWLITKTIDCSGVDQLTVNFDILYSGNGPQPRLFYTNSYNANSTQSNWTELDYSLGANRNEWYSVDEILINSPGDIIYFAFHYQAAANAGSYFLLDNFSVKEYIAPPIYDLVGSSEHFDFYTNLTGQANFYLSIQDELEQEYTKLSSYWNRPLGDPIFDATTKIKVHYCNRDDVPQVSEETPDWKCGFHNTSEKTIFLSPPFTSEMYSDLTFLAIDEFAQLSVHRKLQRDGENNCPEYFLEGFGLYEAGFKPRVDSIKKYMEDLQKPQVSFIQDISNLPTTFKKDVAVSLVEAQTLGGWGYDGIGPGASSFFDNDWGTHLKYFYLNEDEERFQLLLSSTHFTFYAFPRDQKYAQEFIDTLENVYNEYVNLLDIEHNHPIAAILFSDETTGRTLGAWGSGSANGCSSFKVGFWDLRTSSLLTEEAFCGILKHELSHNLSNHFNTGFGFYNEGIAVHMSKYPYKLSDIYQDKDRIARVFDFYLETYGHLPTMDEFVNDPYLNLGGFVEEDIYYFAPIFYYFIFENYNYENVKNFIINHYDFEGAFGQSKLEIEEGYINYLNSILNNTPPEPLAELPFTDDFSNNYENWTTISVTGDDVWHISNDDGIDFGKCARFYPTSNPRQANNDWLVSPVFNTNGMKNIAVTFKYLFTADGATPEFYYATAFDGDPANSNWIHIDKSFWINNWGWQDARIEIANPGESFVFAVRYNVTANDSYYFLMDNFSIEAYEPVAFEKIGTTDHFEFYAETSLGNQYWNEINTQVENWYAELCSYWDRPGRAAIYESDLPIKIYLTSQQGIRDATGIDLHDWKHGGYKTPNELYVAVPKANDPVYNGSFATVCKNVLSQLLLKKRYLNEGNNDLPSYFSEAFGQYYCGYRPNKDSVLKAISDYGGYPKLADIKNTNGFDVTYRKDLLVSYVESQALSRIGIQWIFYDGHEILWQRHFKYFYELDDDDCIQLRDQTDHFNLYFSEQDRPYMSQISSKLEEKFAHYTKVFELDIKHKFSVVIYPSEQAGMYCLVYSDNYNGGSAWSGDILDFLSPKAFGGGIDEALRSLIPHEFFHAFHFNFVTHLFSVAPFNSEGMAELMAYGGENEAYLRNYSGYFEDGFKRFKNEHGREPKLADIMPDGNSYMSVYTYGHAFWYFMIQNYTDYVTIKSFFEKGEDWSVFDVSYETIDSAYIAYLKSFFETVATKPEVSTLQASEIKMDGATLNGKVTTDGGSSITQRGFYWSSSNSNPGSGDHVENVNGTTGEFLFELTGLSAGTTYFYKAFATNSAGTSTGEVMEFSTNDEQAALITLPFTDPFEDDYLNWTPYSLAGEEIWHISPDDGMDGSRCARFYITSNPMQANVDWLVSDYFNVNGMSRLKVSFDFFWHTEGRQPEFFYTNEFNGDIEFTNWNHIENDFWDQGENHWAKAALEIDNSANQLAFAMQYSSMTSGGQYVLIDNFSIQEGGTGVTIYANQPEKIQVFPNPLTEQTRLVFFLNGPDKVTLELFNAKGMKQLAISEQVYDEGWQDWPIGQYFSKPGFYYAKLTSSKWVFTVKLLKPIN